jgi:hypothetical protein
VAGSGAFYQAEERKISQITGQLLTYICKIEGNHDQI